MWTTATTASSCPAEDAAARHKPTLRDCLEGVAPACITYRVAVLSVAGVVAVVCGVDLVQREARASARPVEFGYLRYNIVYWSEVAAFSCAALAAGVVAVLILIGRARQRQQRSRGLGSSTSGGPQLTGLGSVSTRQTSSSSSTSAAPSSLSVLMSLAASRSMSAGHA